MESGRQGVAGLNPQRISFLEKMRAGKFRIYSWRTWSVEYFSRQSTDSLRYMREACSEDPCVYLAYSFITFYCVVSSAWHIRHM